jgi:uncharacterized membrane protein
MTLLALGLALFIGIHLLPSVAPTAYGGLKQSLGEGPVKGIYALASLAGIVLIVIGWRSADTQWLYTPPAALRLPALLLLVIGVWLFAVANRPSLLKQKLRHPQLTGLFLWCAAHLMVNGDSRSLLLFGALGLWSLVAMPLINRRDGAYAPPAAPPVRTDIVTAVLAVVVFALLAWAHPWLAGVAVIPA